jgi:uncharacterized heparinase superfamily protein
MQTSSPVRSPRSNWHGLKPPAIVGPPPQLSGKTPDPIFPPRPASVVRDATGWRFRFLGYEERFGPTIDWQRRPATRSVQLWRMNLHYLEFLETLPDDAFGDVVRQWVNDNPPFAPGAHRDGWNAYAASLRVVVLAQQFAVRRARLAEADRALLTGTIAVHLRFLVRRLETDIGGNHLIKNIKALIWGSALFTGTEAARWRRRGLALLMRELPRQFLADGFHYELSTAYHGQVTADLLEIRHVLGADAPPLLTSTIRAALAAVAMMRHPDGLIAQFGDAGITMSYPPDTILAAAPDIAPDAASIPVALRDAGYWTLKDGDDALFFDAGKIAADALPAHGHGDALSIEWSVAGRRVFVDQGVFEYVGGPDRDASRAAAHHNTLSIAGMDQAEFFGAFRVGARARVNSAVSRHDGQMLDITGWHDGFVRTGGPRHRRRLVVQRDRLAIDDQLDGAAAGGVTVGLLLHPDVSAELIDAHRCTLRAGAAVIYCRSDHPLEIVDAMWWPDMGFAIPTHRIVMAWPQDVRVGTFECRVTAR